MVKLIQFYLCFDVFSPSMRPKLIEALLRIRVIDVAAGAAHSACIGSGGILFTWGKGRYGRLGHGDSEDTLMPKRVCLTVSWPKHKYSKKRAT